MTTLRSICAAMTLALLAGCVAAQKTNISSGSDIEKFTKEIALHPDDPDAYLGRGRAYLTLRSFDLAVADFTTAVKVSTHPYYVSRALLDRGDAYSAQANYPLAISDFGKIIQMKTPAVYREQAYRKRAEAYVKNGDDRMALADADRAVALTSRSRSLGSKERLGKAYETRVAINCRLGNKAAVAADRRKQVGLGLKVLEKCS